jgi:hypothetical protein
MPRKQHQITASDGRTLSTEAWARELGATRGAVLRRVQKTGCPLTPLMRSNKHVIVASDGRRNTIAGWAEELGISYSGVRNRVRVHGCPTKKVRCNMSVTHHARSHEWWEGANDLPWARDSVAQRVVRGMGPMMYDEIGVCLGVSRPMVARIERSAIKKLQQALITRGTWNETRDMLVERVRLADERRHWALEAREEE